MKVTTFALAGMLSLTAVSGSVPTEVSAASILTQSNNIPDEAKSSHFNPVEESKELDLGSFSPDEATAETSLAGSSTRYVVKLPLDHPDRRCSAAEVATWRSNIDFSLTINEVAVANFGMPGPVATGLVQKYPVLTPQCVECFTNNVFCGATKCLLSCAGRTLSSECLKCCEQKCNPELQKCLDVSDADMPPVPKDSDLATTTRTPPQTRAVRVRRAPASVPETAQTTASIITDAELIVSEKLDPVPIQEDQGPQGFGVDIRVPIAVMMIAVLAGFIFV